MEVPKKDVAFRDARALEFYGNDMGILEISGTLKKYQDLHCFSTRSSTWAAEQGDLGKVPFKMPIWAIQL